MAPEAQALPVDASPSGPDRAGAPSLPWIVAAASLLALLGVIAFILLPGARSPGDPSAPIAAPLGDPAGIDLATMTPRDAADRLFNRVMERVSAGDTTEARAFQPMALAAYERVEELDLDGHYHVALLQLVGGDPQAARARADTILRQVPNHLLGLHTAAQAEERMGNPDAAVPLYVQFLENYEEEVAVGRSEYREHAPVLPLLRQEAESAAGGTR